jgi:D-alanyl-D-alanine carboxypeptidase (penicillin-binding protein 5/6)
MNYRRKRKRHAARRAFVAIAFAALAITAGFSLTQQSSVLPSGSQSPVNDGQTLVSGAERPAPEPAKEPFDASGLSLNSPNAILISLTGGEVLLEENATERVYPASLTKIMTAVVALENLSDLSETYTLPKTIYARLWEANASQAGFQPEETVALEDLLYGLLLSSGGECALGLAQRVAGSEQAFVALMNEKAKFLGMDGTHFENTTGLHDEDHRSTVRDMGILFEYALQNPTFYAIITAKSRHTRPTDINPRGITLTSTLFSKTASADFPGGTILGGKTGYTAEAGQCLASLAETGGESYILVTCGAPGDNNTQTLHIDDAKAVFAAIAERERPSRENGNPPPRRTQPPGDCNPTSVVPGGGPHA